MVPGRMARAVLLFLFSITVCVCHLGKEDSGIRISGPMDGWVLTQRPIAINFFALKPCGELLPPASDDDHDTSCNTRVHLDGKFLLKADMRDPEGHETVPVPVTVAYTGNLKDGQHVLEVLVESSSGNRTPMLAARSVFYLHTSGGPWPDWWHERDHHAELEEEAVPDIDSVIVSSNHRRHPEVRIQQRGARGWDKLRSVALLYHRNIEGVYADRWMDKCISSILAQTVHDFDIFELNYGSTGGSIMARHVHLLEGRGYIFMQRDFENHAQAMNFLLDEVFERGYDVAFNVNMDDFYAPTRFERQLAAVREGADLVSSYFARIVELCDGRVGKKCVDGKDEFDLQPDLSILTHVQDEHELLARDSPSLDNIRTHLAHDHNVLCHPGMAFTRNFWQKLSALGCIHTSSDDKQQIHIEHAKAKVNHRFEDVCWGRDSIMSGILRPLRYRMELPAEDLRLWQRALLMSDVNLTIVPEVLVYYRLHLAQVSTKRNPLQWNTNMFTSAYFQARLRVGILTVCTGKYTQHFERHVQTIASKFLPGHPKSLFVFTDDTKHAMDVFQRLLSGENRYEIASVNATYIPCRGFPADTLYRYHYFLIREHEILTQTDVVFYMDVDLIVEAEIAAPEVCPTRHRPLVAVRHPLQDHGGTPESRVESAAFIGHREPRPCYIAGGFIGGRAPEFLDMAREISARIDRDDDKEVVGIWHDESHLNRYLVSHPHMFRVLPPAYLYPDSWAIPYERRIIVQRISHNETRYAQELFVSVCRPAADGLCELDSRLGSLLFATAAAIGAAHSLNQSHTAVLPLNWCFSKSEHLCVGGGSEGGRSSFRSSWLHFVRRSDSLVDMDFTNVLERDVGVGEWNEIVKRRPAGSHENWMLIGTFWRTDLFHPFARDAVLAALKMPPKLERKATAVYRGIRVLFDYPTVCARVRHAADLRALEIAAPDFGFEASYFVLFCTSTARDLCNLRNPFIGKFPQVHMADGDSAVNLRTMSLCDKNLVSDSFSWWAAYLGKGGGPGSVGDGHVLVATRWADEDGEGEGFDARGLVLPEWREVEVQ